MKKLIKISLFTVAFLVLFAAAFYIYMLKAYPKINPPQDIKISATPEMLKRGEYLFNNVCGCADCHSTRDYSKYAGPLTAGTTGKGGFEFSEELGLPGKFYAKNITPAGLKDWTDGEILRAMTEGVSKNGEPLFPIMPYPAYGKMDKDDVYSIIAYLRSLPPVENKIENSKPSFPMNLIMRTIPEKSNFRKIPDKSNTVEYGKYLVNIAGCNDCHTQQVKGEFQMDKYLAGGQEFKLPGGIIVRPANITPDKQTGLGSWTKENFLNKFHEYSKEKYIPSVVKDGDFNTIMPWTFFSGMTDEDLSAIYDYLRTINPVYNQVTKFEKEK